MMNHKKYKPFPSIKLENRQWPNKTIEKAPIWCSVDLRDGNQALINPMTLDQKINFFNFLIKMGFKEIEIGFPAASDTEFTFTRTLIEKNLIPDDVVIQVLTQSREHIIEKTFKALEGVKKAVVHLYNSTSTLQRRVVFGNSKEETVELALFGARKLNEFAEKYGREHFIFEYSPESFTGTELDFAASICNEVLKVWEPTPERKVIINLPSTVEMASPNVYADQIEYMCNNLYKRENVIVSLHAHNDRGTAVASTELGVLAGADRVEGTLFGNGERTGNADILNLAMNLYTQGIDPELDFSNMESIVDIYEKSTNIKLHPRHPYAGELVFTAFSGSHQDAIKKGMAIMEKDSSIWEVPYLPIDPADIGRSYDPIIRINSQSGKGGVSYILEHNYGLSLPKGMQQHFGGIITEVSDNKKKELQPEEIYDLFFETYIKPGKLELKKYKEETNGISSISCIVSINGVDKTITGEGNGILDSFSKALEKELGFHFDIQHYSEHSLEYGKTSRAITYVQISNCENKVYYGAGISTSITKSSLRAIVSALNQLSKIKDL